MALLLWFIFVSKRWKPIFCQKKRAGCCRLCFSSALSSCVNAKHRNLFSPPLLFSHRLSLPLTLLLVFSITHTHITVFTHIPLTVLVHSGAQETSCEKTIDISGATTHTMWCPAAPKQLSFSRQVLMLCKKQMCPSLRQWS